MSAPKAVQQELLLQRRQTADASGQARAETARRAAYWEQRALDIITERTADPKYLGATADEIAEQCGVEISTIAPRVTALFHATLVRPSGIRRLTRRGKSANVFERVPAE